MRHKGQAHWFSSKCPPLSPEISLSDCPLFCFLPFHTFSLQLFSFICHLICNLYSYLLIWQSYYLSTTPCLNVIFCRSPSVSLHIPLSLLYLFIATSLLPSSSCSSLSLSPLSFSLSSSVLLCQLCDEPGADKRWSASLQMAAWAAAVWGVWEWVVMG